MPVQLNSEPRPLVHMEGRQETPVGESCISFFIWYAQENKLRYGIIRQTEFPFGKPHHHCIPFPRVRPAQYSRFRTVFPEEFKFFSPLTPDSFKQFTALILDKDIPLKAGCG